MKPLMILSVLFVFALAGCGEEVPRQLAATAPGDGDYILTFEIGEGLELPVNAKIESQRILVINGDEMIEAVEVVFEGESLTFRMPAFNNRFVLKVAGEGFAGQWHNYARGDQYAIPVQLVPGTERFQGESTTDVSGNWKVTFSEGTEDESIAKGVFKQKDSVVTGTFRTTTGDYRFLQGGVDGDEIRLSCFDGAHAFLFTATLEEETLGGIFYSGKHWQEPWTAVRMQEYELPDPDTLTSIREGESFAFSFPNTRGETVHFADYSGKPTIVQITGTWCPNCMDETALLNQLYDKYHPAGLEIVALAFEPTAEFEQAVGYIERFRQDMDVKYEMLIAGTKDKGEAVKSLPMLNHIMSFPTTLFFDRQGTLLKLHTGFNGPGTGEVYTEFVTEITGLIENRMLQKR
jgi:thiol-disulfide isomerase/thioredoxin